MTLEFKTKRNKQGNTYYLCIDTDNHRFTRVCPKMVAEGVVVTKRDYDKLVQIVHNYNFMEVN